ncbi:hypothetical protein [Streptomyces sp. NBC_01296]|uniref:hypothetical protein n=1 Tax=Streptomyces sp. NBC_01296 TaxID=2903816 RepID=UPI002E14BE3E|nr:hypothetical protein OG299_00640 [Streptomyces sp. NBC_01296]
MDESTAAGDPESVLDDPRLERLRQILTGERPSPLVRTQGREGTKANLLLAVMLRAAARTDRGHQLGDLENRLVQAALTAMPQTDLIALGRLYLFLVTYSTGLPFPVSVTGRPLEQTYDWAQYQQDWQAMARETMAQPNNAVVSREGFALGEEVDGPAFIEALRERGGGTSAMPGAVVVSPDTLAAVPDGDSVAPGVEDASAAEASAAGTHAYQPVRVRLEMESFHVLRAHGDQGGGRDETYWCASSGSDKAAGPAYQSEEFGGVQTGHTRTFGSNRVVFDGQVSAHLILQIFCFEADQSSSQWYDALHAHLRWLSQHIFSTPWFQIGANLPGGGIAGILADITSIGVILMDFLRNDDDLSCARAIYLDRYDLALLSDRGSIDLHFNGEGHHRLKLKYASPEKVPFPASTLKYLVREQGDRWTTPIPLPWQSITPPAIAFYQNRLHVLFNRADRALMWTTHANGVWSTPRQINQEYSDIAPALAVFQNKLWCAHTGTDDTVGYFTYDGTSWSTRTRILAFASRIAPALAVHDNRLWLTHISMDGIPCTNCHDGSRWTGSQGDNSWTLDSPVSLASNSGKLWRVARGTDNGFHASNATTSGNNVTWNRIAGISHPNYPHGPALLSHSGGLEVFLNLQGELYQMHYLPNQNMWHGGKYPGDQRIRPMDEVSTAEQGGRLYVMYRTDPLAATSTPSTA